MPAPRLLSPTVTVVTRARPGHASQDRHLILANAVAVLDGATSSDFPVGRDAAWYADLLIGPIATHLSETQLALSDVVEAAIARTATQYELVSGASPSSTVTMLRWTDDASPIEALVLADSPLVVRYLDGTTEVHCDNRIDHCAAQLQNAYRTRLAAGSGYDADHARLMRDLGAFLRTGRNQPGGFWVAEADPRAAQEAVALSLDPQRVQDAAILTDGASAAVDLYGLFPDWATALDLMRDDGPDALLEAVRQAEATDPDGRHWPRAKVHDDATAVYLDFTAGRA